mgnify:CR=1 FL=1
MEAGVSVEEQEAIAAAGLILQIDDAWLPALWDRIGMEMGLAAFRARCEMRIEALNHALRLGGRSLRVHRVLANQIDLPTQQASCGVDLLCSHLDALHSIFTQRSQKTSHGRQVANADRPGLCEGQQRMGECNSA